MKLDDEELLSSQLREPDKVRVSPVSSQLREPGNRFLLFASRGALLLEVRSPKAYSRELTIAQPYVTINPFSSASTLCIAPRVVQSDYITYCITISVILAENLEGSNKQRELWLWLRDFLLDTLRFEAEQNRVVNEAHMIAFVEGHHHTNL